MSALCHERLTWPIDETRGGVARWEAGRERWLAHTHYGGEGCGLIWAGLPMGACYYPGERKSAADPS